MFLLGIVISDKIVTRCERGYYFILNYLFFFLLFLLFLNTTKSAAYLLPSRPDSCQAWRRATLETNIWIWIFPIFQTKLK